LERGAVALRNAKEDRQLSLVVTARRPHRERFAVTKVENMAKQSTEPVFL